MPHLNVRSIRSWIDLQAWGIALAAAAPVLLVYILYFLLPPEGTSATGFLQFDHAYYMANAQALRLHGSGPFYGLPFSPYDTTPNVYFQPLIVVFAVLLDLTKAQPGYIFAFLAPVFAVLMFRVSIAMVEAFGGRHRDLPGVLTCFAVLWGGGVVFAAGTITWLASARPRPWFLDSAFSLDPGDGWWILNLGRNALFPMEAFYHALYFGACVQILRRKYFTALILAAALSSSHPFTGLEFLLIACVFACTEFLLDRSTAPPVWFTASLLTILVLHILYYIVALKLMSPEHALLERQWSLGWTLPLSSSVVAYGPAFILAAVALVRYRRNAVGLPDQKIRFAIVWFLVAFALANHELFISPRQPLHFTRGYVWTPLALIALPVVAHTFRRYATAPPRIRAFILYCPLIFGLTLDNAAWLGREYVYRAERIRAGGVYLTTDSSNTLGRLSQADMRGRLLLSNDEYLCYMATVYVPLRAWYSHPYNTPEAATRLEQLHVFFATGAEVPEWRNRDLVVVNDTTLNPRITDRLVHADFRPVGIIGRYSLFVRDAK